MSEQLFDLPIRLCSRWIFNCYVVGDPGTDVVLIDPGLPSVTADALECIRREAGSNVAQPAALISTHAHPDHVGGIPHVLEQAEVPAYLPTRCEKYLNGETPRTFGVNDAIRFMPVWGDQKFSFATMREFGSLGKKIGFGGPKELTIPFTPEGFLAESDPVPSMARWEVIEAPGHTDDSICLYHRESATLLSGDAVVSLNGRAWFNPEWVDASLSAETEERLRALEVRHLLPGHGRPIEASSVWDTARSFRDQPEGKGILARCSRRFGHWDIPDPLDRKTRTPET